MMHGPEKSDSAIRTRKPANKAGRPAAERVEQRAGTKGNAGQPGTQRTQGRASGSQWLDRVRQVAGTGFYRPAPAVGAVCSNRARTDLCGGCPVTGIPTAITFPRGFKEQRQVPHEPFDEWIVDARRGRLSGGFRGAGNPSGDWSRGIRRDDGAWPRGGRDGQASAVFQRGEAPDPERSRLLQEARRSAGGIAA